MVAPTEQARASREPVPVPSERQRLRTLVECGSDVAQQIKTTDAGKLIVVCAPYSASCNYRTNEARVAQSYRAIESRLRKRGLEANNIASMTGILSLTTILENKSLAKGVAPNGVILTSYTQHSAGENWDVKNNPIAKSRLADLLGSKNLPRMIIVVDYYSLHDIRAAAETVAGLSYTILQIQNSQPGRPAAPQRTRHFNPLT